LALIACAALFACKKDNGIKSPGDGGTNEGDSGDMTGDGGVGSDGGEILFPQSGKATIKFKHVDRLRNDFAQALGLDPAKLCKEFGQYSCTDLVHTIALGGVEPYVLGIRDPFPLTTITTPMAVERVAFAGCAQRVAQDLGDPVSALIFKGLTVGNDGAFPDIDAPQIQAAIDALYQRTMLRNAQQSEVEHLKQLYRDVLATNEPGPARDWAILACFSVLTTMESLFY
jgi:hypothetical protein